MCHPPLKWLRNGGSVLVSIAPSVSAAVQRATICSTAGTAAGSPTSVGVVPSRGVHGHNHEPHELVLCPSRPHCLCGSTNRPGNIGSSVMNPSWSQP